jgi:hypothetical protein
MSPQLPLQSLPLEQFPGALVCLDGDFKVAACNPAALQLLDELRLAGGRTAGAGTAGLLAVWLQGDLAAHFVSVGRNVTAQRQAEAAREKLVTELQAALARVEQLSGLLSICAHCRKIKDANGVWENLDTYLHKHARTSFSHGICPACAATYFGDLGKLGPDSDGDRA